MCILLYLSWNSCRHCSSFSCCAPPFFAKLFSKSPFWSSFSPSGVFSEFVSFPVEVWASVLRKRDNSPRHTGWAEQAWYLLFSTSAAATRGGNQLYLQQRKTSIWKIIRKNFLAIVQQCMGTATAGSCGNSRIFKKWPYGRYSPIHQLLQRCHLILCGPHLTLSHADLQGSALFLPHHITSSGLPASLL